MGKTALVIGGGIIGLCAAYYAARRGVAVTVVEAAAPDDGGCSHGNAGLVVPSHFVPLAAPGAVGSGLRWLFDAESPFYIQPRASLELAGWMWRFLRFASQAHVERAAPILRDLNLASRAAYEALAADGPDFGLAKDGVLLVCRTEHGLKEEAEVAHRAQQLGLQAEVLDPRQTAEREPALSSKIAGSVYYPQDCQLDPERLIAGLRRRLQADGVTMRWRCPVEGWQVDGRQVQAVQTADGPLTADEYVIAGGAWSGRIARQLRQSLPLQAGRGYSLTLPSPPVRLRSAALLIEDRVAVTPMPQRLRFAGTMELVGMERPINPARVRGITKAIPRYYPGFEASSFVDIEPWSGLRPCSPDGLPYIGRLRRFDNVVVATGHAMMGISLGPITGQLVSAVLTDSPPRLPLDGLRPDRFA